MSDLVYIDQQFKTDPTPPQTPGSCRASSILGVQSSRSS